MGQPMRHAQKAKTRPGPLPFLFLNAAATADGKLAPPTNDAPKQKTNRIRMSANLSQRQVAGVRPNYKAQVKISRLRNSGFSFGH